MKKKFVLLGNKIGYSKSPIIHNIFYKEFNLNYEYILYDIEIKNLINTIIFLIENKNFYGFNVTIPFKELIFNYCDILSKNSYILKSINTVSKNYNNLIVGNNTDGIGILIDLKRINFIKKNYNILIIGSGGAIKGIIIDLYLYTNKIYIASRNIEKLYKIKNLLLLYNIKNIYLYNLYNIDYKIEYNLIINATSSSYYKKKLLINYKKIINNNTKCYDLFYNLKENTYFIEECKINGSKYCSDGIGMLVSQAAYSFYIWNKIMPDIDLTIKKIKKNNYFL